MTRDLEKLDTKLEELHSEAIMNVCPNCENQFDDNNWDDDFVATYNPRAANADNPISDVSEIMAGHMGMRCDAADSLDYALPYGLCAKCWCDVLREAHRLAREEEALEEALYA